MDRAKEDLLVLSAQAGDVRAFETLFRFHNAPLQRFAYRLCGDHAMALDAVQEAWVSLSRTLKKLQDPRGFRVWAYKTVRWRVTDMARKRGAPVLSLDDLPDGFAAEARIEPDATSDQLDGFLAALPAAERQLLSLFYLEELKLSEIAGVLDMPLGTVKSRMNRARARLRQQIEGDS